MKIIKHIFDGDFGCEESASKKPMVSVTLMDDSGEESFITIEDDWLCKQNLDVGSKWPEYMIRIGDMEKAFDKVNYTIEHAPAMLEECRPEIQSLEAYYASRQWKEDFALDEAGALPDGLKRGVLSEDGIYNLLEKVKEL